MNFLGGGGFCEARKFKEMYDAQLEFPEGWGGSFGKIPSMGEVWIFSGIATMTMKVNLIVSYRDEKLSHCLSSENKISTLSANPSIYSM